MSGGAVLAVVKVVSTVFAVKTAVEGLQEGNLLKAAIGGAGAYFGMKGMSELGTLGQGATEAASQGASNAMSGAADFVAQDAAQLASQGLGTEQISSALINSGVGEQAAQIAAQNAAFGAGEVASGLSQFTSSAAMSDLAGMTSDAMIESSSKGLLEQSQKGFMDKLIDDPVKTISDGVSKVGDFAEKNEGLLKMGGDGIKSYLDQQNMERQLSVAEEAQALREEQQALKEEEYRRYADTKGYAPAMYSPNWRKIQGVG